MLEKPDIDDQRIKDRLGEEYGLRARHIQFLPIGADVNSAVYRVFGWNEAKYFLKLRKGNPNEAIVAVPQLLFDEGIREIVPILKTRKGLLWGQFGEYKIILYPLIKGKDGYHAAISEPQWVELGEALRKIHAVKVPEAVAKLIARETYSAYWRERVKEFQAMVEEQTFDEPVAKKLAQFMKTQRGEIDRLVGRAEELGRGLAARKQEAVLCHSDLHAGNLLISPNGKFYIVDWDAPIFAPRERDLMFIGSGISTSRETEREEALFYQGYGPVDVDQTVLAYYRLERIVEDFATFGEQLLLTDKGGEDREQGFGFFCSNFLPGNTIEIAWDTNSRLDLAQVAYDKVSAATKVLQQAGCRQFFNKTCSVFRGNIGPEFDAMLDVLGLEFAVVVLGFPKNGRTTVDGIHYVYSRKLEESEFRHDPIHPMTRSDLVGILQSQTERKVGLITHEVISKGPQALRQRLNEMKSEYQYVILDVVDQDMLKTIAQAVYDEPVLCGSSALAEELPAVWGPAETGFGPMQLPAHPGLGILCAAGSLMPQTAAQIDHLRQQGAPVFELDTLRLFEPAEREAEIERKTQMVVKHLQDGKDVVFQTPNEAAKVEAAHSKGLAQGLTRTEVSRMVSEALAEVTARALEISGQNRLVVAGGETSAAVCARLGVNGMQVWKEIQPGLPSCVTLGEPKRLLVLKSGSFGKPDFFERAIEHLKEQ